jgi:gliding motility-associated-like protein
MRLIGFLVLFFISFNINSQVHCPELGPDQNLPCGVVTTTLTADLSQCGVGGLNPNETSNYSVSNITYNNQTNTGTQLTMTDDSQQGPFNIGFNFCFFGTTYNQFYVGSNGWISFSSGQPTTFASVGIPSTLTTTPKNCIMGPWQDWHPGLGGQIRYQLSGTAPCRKLTVSWIGVPMYSCTTLQGTFHIVIYESTNIIENFIQEKPNCLTWPITNPGSSVQGLHNLAGNFAVTVPGRNGTVWTTTNDAYRYTPSGPSVLPVLTWYQVGNPISIGVGSTITITPSPGGAQYTCHLEYPSCNAGWNTCNQISGGIGPDTILVIPGPPNLSLPIINTVIPTCNGYCDGSINIIPVNGNPPYTYNWLGSGLNTNTQTNLCSGVYNVLITDNTGCDITSQIVLSEPDQLSIDSINVNNVTCNLNDGEVYIYANGGTPQYNYTVNSLISNDTITYLSGGEYYITVFDINGCSVNDSVYVAYPTPINISISAVDSTLCVPGSFNFINSSSPSNNIVTSTVNYGDGLSDIINSNSNFTHTYNTVGTWDVSVTTISDYGCVYTNIFDNIVETMALPVSQFMISPNPTTMFETTVTAQDYSLNATSWYWNAPGSLEGSSVMQEPTFEYPEGVINDYIISLTVQNSLGCVDSSSIILHILTDVLVYIPNAFTPGDDEFNSSWRFYLSGVDSYDFTMNVYNRWGEVVWECHDINGYWDGSYKGYYVPDGVYIWHATYKANNSTDKEEINGTLTILR